MVKDKIWLDRHVSLPSAERQNTGFVLWRAKARLDGHRQQHYRDLQEQTHTLSKTGDLLKNFQSDFFSEKIKIKHMHTCILIAA